MTYLYILWTAKNTFYCGMTSDLKRRMTEHQCGKVKSTRYSRPLRLVHYECYLLKEDASRRKRFLKTTEGKRELRKQIKLLVEHLHSGVVQR